MREAQLIEAERCPPAIDRGVGDPFAGVEIALIKELGRASSLSACPSFATRASRSTLMALEGVAVVRPPGNA